MSHSTAARVLPRPSTRPVARTATPPRLRVVAPRTGRSRAGLAVLCISLLITGLIALLLLNISISNGAYELTSLQKTQLQASEQRQKLAEEVDQRSAPQELAKRAAALGMVAAPNTAFVRLSDGTIIGKAAKALPPPKPPKPKLKGAVGGAATAGAVNGGVKTGAKAGATAKIGAPATKTNATKGTKPADSTRPPQR